jgi:glycolate oxidase FAD binding subunit
MPSPRPDFEPESQAALGQWMVENYAGPSQVVLPLGGGTSPAWPREPLAGTCVVGTTRLNQVIDYPVRDMTITVEAGVRFGELQRILGESGQQLPLDIAHSELATIGGVVATNSSGCRRFGQGTIRDALIGVSAIDVQGRLFKSGGRVVKNVAGYDLCKMLIGSQGSLAIITQVTLKLRPLSHAAGVLWVPLSDLATAEPLLSSLTTSQTRPVAVELWNRQAAQECLADIPEAVAGSAGFVCFGFEGSETEVRWQLETLAREVRSLANQSHSTLNTTSPADFWQTLNRFQSHPCPPLFKITAPPSRVVELLSLGTRLGCSLAAHAGTGIVWGRLPEQASAEEIGSALAPLTRLANEAHGQLRLVGLPPELRRGLPESPLSATSERLIQTLKMQLDPRHLLSPGSLVPPPRTA